MKYYLSVLIITSLLGCSTSTFDYQNTKPEFDLKEFFTGELKGWGLVKNYQGKVTKRFSVEMTGTWEDNKGVLYELFTYQDGTTQERTWHLTKQQNNFNTGIANDVVGEASGVQQGFAFNWNYDLLFESDSGQIQIHLNDWLYQVDDDAVISEAKIKKFGVNVGEVIVFILKQDTEK
jgi:uncharacterized protein affecting Mg2+/Co2+ transport